MPSKPQVIMCPDCGDERTVRKARQSQGNRCRSCASAWNRRVNVILEALEQAAHRRAREIYARTDSEINYHYIPEEEREVYLNLALRELFTPLSGEKP